jgi:hypothetical protein
MAKYCFDSTIKFTKASMEYLDKVNPITDKYKEMKHMMTLRQLYYQFVGQVVIGNENSAYRKLSRLLTDGRMASYVDWDAIGDRLRQPRLPYWMEGVPEANQDTAKQYRINRMDGQPNYIEVWVEKDALSGVWYKITSEYYIRLMVNRGFSSCTAMYDAYRRFLEHTDMGQRCIILYIGDHDPSGMFMCEDVQARLHEFGLNDIEMRRTALNIDQVQKYNLPENNLKSDDNGKLKDPRGNAYMKKYGNRSWEVDALDPLVLDHIVKDEIESVIDKSLYLDMIKKEDLEQGELYSIANRVKDYYTGVSS